LGFAFEGCRTSFRVPVLSETTRVSGFSTRGSLDAVFEGRKIFVNTLTFLPGASETCEEAGGGADGGRAKELIEGAAGEGARTEGSRKDGSRDSGARTEGGRRGRTLGEGAAWSGRGASGSGRGLRDTEVTVEVMPFAAAVVVAERD
jgi:hypothetical protein